LSDEAKVLGDKLALVISVIRPVGDGGQVQFQTTVPQDASKEDLNALVDKLHAAGRRLAVWGGLEKTENELDHLALEEAQHEFNLQLIREKSNGAEKMLTADKNNMTQSRDSMIRIGAVRTKLAHKRASLMTELGVS